MKLKHSSTDKKQSHSHTKHMWMMVLCCGLPIVGFLAIGALGISSPSLETLIAIICPIGMIGMMYMMHRDQQKKNDGGHACCQNEAASNHNEQAGLVETSGKKLKDEVQIKESGSLKA
jgi:hypothetical protein